MLNPWPKTMQAIDLIDWIFAPWHQKLHKIFSYCDFTGAVGSRCSDSLKSFIQKGFSWFVSLFQFGWLTFTPLNKKKPMPDSIISLCTDKFSWGWESNSIPPLPPPPLMNQLYFDNCFQIVLARNHLGVIF